MKNKKWIFRLIGIVILIYILFTVDFKEYAHYIEEIRISGIIYASVIILLIYFAKSLRWMILLKSQGIKYSYKNTFLAFTGSNFIAFITPGRLGEFAKVFYLKNDLNIPVSRSVSSVITDRLFDVYALFCFGIYGIVSMGVSSRFLLYFFIIILLILPLLFFHRSILNFWIGLLVRLPIISKIASRKNTSIDQFKKGFLQLITIRLFYAGIITVIAYLALYLAAWFIAGAIRIEPGFINIVFVVSVANILSFLPISVSGLGTREAVFIYFLNGMNYTTEQALVFSTLFFFCFYIVGGLYAYTCFMIKPVSLKRIKKEMR